MVPSVLPWVPFPLPGAPNRMNVRYFMKANGYTALAANREEKRLFRSDRIDIDSSSTPIEANVAVDQRAAESFYTEPLANAVAAVLNAALSFFMSHDLRFFRF